MTFIVATNFVANRPQECRPTGRATARANLELSASSGKQIVYEVLPRYSFIDIPNTPCYMESILWGKVTPCIFSFVQYFSKYFPVIPCNFRLYIWYRNCWVNGGKDAILDSRSDAFVHFELLKHVRNSSLYLVNLRYLLNWPQSCMNFSLG